MDGVEKVLESSSRDRRVFAVRDFPPLCGPKAPRPPQERPIRSQAESVDGAEKVEAIKTSGGAIRENASWQPSSWQLKSKAVAKKSKTERAIVGGPSMKKIERDESRPSNPSMKKIEQDERRPSNSRATIAPRDSDGDARKQVLESLISFRSNPSMKKIERDESRPSNPSMKKIEQDESRPPNSRSTIAPRDSDGDARKQVLESLISFRSICQKILEDEAKSEKKTRRIDLFAARIIKKQKMKLNLGKQFLGEVQGVKVGDEFHYRVELAIVGIHRLYQDGIDSMMHNGTSVAISVVHAGVYSGDKNCGDVLIYSGQGGNFVNTGRSRMNKQPEDQKLERGNLALKNSISMGTPVRVVRGFKDASSSGRLVTMYVYDGLYTVVKYWQERGSHGKLVFMFELRRIPGQPKLRRK